jgi:hypothetical protein
VNLITEHVVREYYPEGAIKTVWDYSTDPWTAYEYDQQGAVVNSRPFTENEVTVAQQRLALETATQQRAALLDQLMTGVVDIQETIDQAQDDIATAEGLQTQAETIKAGATTQRTQIAAFTPAASYSQAQINAIKGQLDQLAARDEVFAQAFADGFAYRRNVDQAMVKAYRAILWLARVISGRLQD